MSRRIGWWTYDGSAEIPGWHLEDVRESSEGGGRS
jgi:hypothetical protein